MKSWIGIAVMAALALWSPAYGQQSEPTLMMVAQAQDRCMTTYAVRLSRQTADEAIFERAEAGCSELDAQLDAAIQRDVPAAKQAEIRAMLANSKKPNFMAMLAKIRSDRASRAADD
jgi:hypothetical protein